MLILGQLNQEPALQVFRDALRELGYVEGQNLRLEVRSAEGEPERLNALAAELVREKVDVIVAWMTPAVLAAKNATTTIPIVMLGAGDPVGTGLVASLARPGGNITGIAGVTAELAGKNLELLKDMVPSLRKPAALCNAPDPFSKPFLRRLQSAGKTLAVEIVPIMVEDDGDLGAAFAAMRKQRVDGIVVQPSLPLRRAAEMALSDRLPAASPLGLFPSLGGLLAYVSPLSENAVRAAVFVDKILKGRSPAELPVEQPTRFELIINMQTAKALGLTVPDTVLARADQVIE